MDRVRSSYAPSLRLLAHRLAEAADPTTGPGLPRLLAVGLTDTPGLEDAALPQVTAELAAVTGAARARQVTVLADDEATVSAVTAALPDHDWLHFACHGRQYPRDPSSSLLHLHDGSLSVRDLRRTDLQHTRLVVLSACQTAISGTTLLDEGLHLGAAMHVAGCREVVGTLWTVGDRSSAQVAEHLFTNLDRDGDPATALHHAVRELRAESPDLCSRWAPFVHIGAGR